MVVTGEGLEVIVAEIAEDVEVTAVAVAATAVVGMTVVEIGAVGMTVTRVPADLVPTKSKKIDLIFCSRFPKGAAACFIALYSMVIFKL